MKKFSWKKLTSAVMALAITASALAIVPVYADSAKYELEDGELTGAKVETDQTGYSGSGYVYLKDAGQKISVKVTVPETGMYEVKFGYNLPKESGSKVQNIYINDVSQGSVSFKPTEGFEEISGGLMRFTEGENTFTIESYWGWTMLDYITVEPSSLSSLDGASDTPCDPQATDSAKRLMSYLSDVYGNGIISGQQEIYGGGPDTEFDYIQNATGKLPAIRGFDFMNYNPLYGWEDNTTSRVIEWTNEKGGIATASWHINVPASMDGYKVGDKLDWSKCTYSNKTDFVTANILVDGTVEQEYFNAAVDMLAEQLKKLDDADVPLIFRPFHEAEGAGGEDGSGAWFWWSKEGADVYKQLWKLLYTKLTDEYGLHNLIWEYNSYTYSSSAAWYPGDEYVDIVGYDKYNATENKPNESAISSVFYNIANIIGGKKMIAMAENDTIPTLENIKEEKAGWLYFCPWYGEFLISSNYNNPEKLKEMYNSDYCITLDELPDLKAYPLPSEKADTSETTTTTAETVETSETTQETTETGEETTVTTEVTTEETSETSEETTVTTEVTTEETSETTETSEETTETTIDEGEYKKGDVNHDGNINIMDLMALAKYIVGTSTEINPEADVNGDGRYNIVDLMEIAKIIVGA